jgi:nucleoid-associated protein YgaU
MTISANSRYANSTVVGATFEGQMIQVITPSQQTAFTFTYVTYVWTGHDRLDRLSYANYGDSSQWWRIADANPEILDFNNLLPGTLIRIPFV